MKESVINHFTSTYILPHISSRDLTIFWYKLLFWTEQITDLSFQILCGFRKFTWVLFLISFRESCVGITIISKTSEVDERAIIDFGSHFRINNSLSEWHFFGILLFDNISYKEAHFRRQFIHNKKEGKYSVVSIMSTVLIVFQSLSFEKNQYLLMIETFWKTSDLINKTSIYSRSFWEKI